MIKVLCTNCSRWAKYRPDLNIHYCTGCGRNTTDEMVFAALRLPRAVLN